MKKVIGPSKKIHYIIGFLPLSWNNSDIVKNDTNTTNKIDLSVVKNETGWERIQQIYRTDDFGRISSELNSIIEVACMSSFIGAVYGGFLTSRTTYMDFMKNNQATSFKNPFDAKKKLQDQVTQSFAKGAFKWGWRLTFFCTTYIGLTTTISAYRGENGILEHSIAGTLAGFLYKFKLGPRAWIVGAGLGVILGSIGGIATSSLLNATGMTMEEVRYWNYKWSQSRSDSFNSAVKDQLKEELEIISEQNKSNKLDNLNSNNVISK